MPFTGCQNVIPSNNHPEDTPSFCNDCKLCIELEVENWGSSGRVGVMSAVVLCLLIWKKEGKKKRKKKIKERKKNGWPLWQPWAMKCWCWLTQRRKEWFSGKVSSMKRGGNTTLWLEDNSGDSEPTLASSTETETGIVRFSLLICNVMAVEMVSHYAFGQRLGEWNLSHGKELLESKWRRRCHGNLDPDNPKHSSSLCSGRPWRYCMTVSGSICKTEGDASKLAPF